MSLSFILFQGYIKVNYEDDVFDRTCLHYSILLYYSTWLTTEHQEGVKTYKNTSNCFLPALMALIWLVAVYVHFKRSPFESLTKIKHGKTKKTIVP